MKTWICRIAMVFVMLIVLLQQADAQEKNEKVLVFGFTPFLDVTEMEEEFGPIVEHIGEVIGIETKMVFSVDYDSLGEDLKDGYVDIAWFTPMTYVIAKEKIQDLCVVATLTEDGKSYYEGFIIARKDAGFNSLNDLEGKSFGFVDVSSSSGYVYPRALLLESGINPVSFFKKMLFLGNHNNVIDAVYNREIDAGATYDAAFASAGKRGIDLSQLTIIIKTDPIPQDAICVRSSLDEELITKITKALLEINKDGERKFSVKGYKKIGFVLGDDSFYDVVRRAKAYK